MQISQRTNNKLGIIRKTNYRYVKFSDLFQESNGDIF